MMCSVLVSYGKLHRRWVCQELSHAIDRLHFLVLPRRSRTLQTTVNRTRRLTQPCSLTIPGYFRYHRAALALFFFATFSLSSLRLLYHRLSVAPYSSRFLFVRPCPSIVTPAQTRSSPTCFLAGRSFPAYPLSGRSRLTNLPDHPVPYRSVPYRSFLISQVAPSFLAPKFRLRVPKTIFQTTTPFSRARLSLAFFSAPLLPFKMLWLFPLFRSSGRCLWRVLARTLLDSLGRSFPLPRSLLPMHFVA